MQESVYKSKEVRIKLADLLVAFQRFNNADTRTVEGMLNETETFLKDMKREYMPELFAEVMKISGQKNKESGG